MRAAIYERTGPASEVLRVTELPDPEPGRGEVRVRVCVAAVNPTDWKARLGFPGRPMPFSRQTPGQDGAGEIDAVGAGVDPTRLGETVWVYHAADGRPSGTAAEYVVVPAEQAVQLPEGVSLDQGAALGIPFLTAHRCLFADGSIDGAHVLVAGGAGAVGNAAIQLAKRAGTQVITTVSSEAKAKLAREAGADEVVVDYTRADAGAEIGAWAPAGVDRILELALGANLELDLEVLASGGTIVTYATEHTEPQLPVGRLLRQNVRLLFMLVYATPPHALRQGVREITDALVEGALRPLPALRFALDEIVAAHEAGERGETGKVLIELP